MAHRAGIITIKKYANRRLYNTGTSTYVTLDDLAKMVKDGVEFHVFDAKSDEDITHIVLTQILLEQESKPGKGILPVEFLRKVISLYEDHCSDQRSDVLDTSLAGLVEQPIRIYPKMRKSFGDAPLSINLPVGSQRPGENFGRRPNSSEIEELKSQLQQLQSRLEQFS